MPVELSELLGGERWIEVDLAGHIVNIAYHPGGLSLTRQAQIEKQMRLLSDEANADEEERAAEISKIFCETICGWDIESGGQPYPLTAASVGNLPYRMTEELMKAVTADIQAQQAEKKRLNASSGAGLPQATRRESVPNGTPSSAPQGTWA